MTLDVKDGRLNYSCAGHPSPVILRTDGTLDILAQRGPIIGSGTSTSYDQETVRLHAGDRVIMYTDGLLESRNPAGDSFGKLKLYEVLAQYRREPIQTMVDAVYARVKSFRQQAAPEDDISLLAVEYRGENQPSYSI